MNTMHFIMENRTNFLPFGGPTDTFSTTNSTKSVGITKSHYGAVGAMVDDLLRLAMGAK